MGLTKRELLMELRAIAQRAGTPQMSENGSETIVIYYSELDALEKAIAFITFEREV